MSRKAADYAYNLLLGSTVASGTLCWDHQWNVARLCVDDASRKFKLLDLASGEVCTCLRQDITRHTSGRSGQRIKRFERILMTPGTAERVACTRVITTKPRVRWRSPVSILSPKFPEDRIPEFKLDQICGFSRDVAPGNSAVMPELRQVRMKVVDVLYNAGLKSDLPWAFSYVCQYLPKRHGFMELIAKEMSLVVSYELVRLGCREE